MVNQLQLAQLLVIGAFVCGGAMQRDLPKKNVLDDEVAAGAVKRLGTTRFRVAAPATSLSIDPKGRFIASTNGRSELFVFDAASGKLLYRLGPEPVYLHPALSPDGSELACLSGESVLFLDPATGRLIRRVARPKGAVGRIAYSPDGRLFALSIPGEVSWPDKEAVVTLWEARTDKELSRLKIANANSDITIAIGPDNKTLAVADSLQGFIELWDLPSSRPIHRLKAPINWTESMAFSPDGALLASGGEDKSVWLWEVRTGRLKCRLHGHGDAVGSVCFSPDGRTLASLADDHRIRLWDPVTGKERVTLMTNESEARWLAFTPDGRKLVSAQLSGVIRFWDPVNGMELSEKPAQREVRSLFFLAGGNQVVTNGPELHVWDWKTGKVVRSIAPPIPADYRVWIWRLGLAADGKKLAAVNCDGTVWIWNTSDWSLLHALKRGTDPVASVALSPDGNVLAWGDCRGVIRLWDTNTGKSIATLRGHRETVLSLAFDPDGKTLVSTGDRSFGDVDDDSAIDHDSTLRLWDVSTGKQITKRRPTAWSAIAAVAFSPDGKLLASAGHDNMIRLWEMPELKQVAELRGHTDSVSDVRFSADGRYLASSSSDNTVRVWDVATRTEKRQFKGHLGWVNCVAFSPDGKHLASGSDDTTVLIWDLQGR